MKSKLLLLGIVILGIAVLVYFQLATMHDASQDKSLVPYPSFTKNETIKTISDQSVWANNNITCSVRTGEMPIKQYPYSSADETEYTHQDLLDFCDNTNKVFSSSYLSRDEAETLYALILRNDFLQDGSYGFPSPDDTIPETTMNTLKERTAIRKIGENTYELFYKEVSCGTNYNYVSIKVKNNTSIDMQPIEEWSASYPC
jgi:hypothetical protein